MGWEVLRGREGLEDLVWCVGVNESAGARGRRRDALRRAGGRRVDGEIVLVGDWSLELRRDWGEEAREDEALEEQRVRIEEADEEEAGEGVWCAGSAGAPGATLAAQARMRE